MRSRHLKLYRRIPELAWRPVSRRRMRSSVGEFVCKIAHRRLVPQRPFPGSITPVPLLKQRPGLQLSDPRQELARGEPEPWLSQGPLRLCLCSQAERGMWACRPRHVTWTANEDWLNYPVHRQGLAYRGCVSDTVTNQRPLDGLADQ